MAVELEQGGMSCQWVQVESRDDFAEALAHQRFDIILADYSLPSFDGISALKIAKKLCPDVPFIFVSATLGEELAIETLKSGATDYVLKQRLSRLVPSVQRAIRESQERRDRIAAETAWQKTLQQLTFHVENSPLALVEWDSQFRVSRWSPQAERLFGWRASEVLGIGFTDWQFIVPEDLEIVQQEMIRLKGQHNRGVCCNRNYTKDGEVIHCEWYNSALFDEQGQLISVLSQVLDVTERQYLETQLRQQTRQLEEANRVKDEFLAVLSHELRSPLNSILGWARLLQSRKFDETTFIRALDTIERNARSQAQLIDDLLDISRLIRGKLRFHLRPIDVIPVVMNACDSIRPTADAKNITLEIFLEPNLGRIQGDPERLQQVIWNLLSNAVKFTPSQGKVMVRAKYDQGSAMIQIQDTGQGIKPDFLPHVFESFRQENSSTTRSQGGLGLGLAIVRSLVECHGGEVWAESKGLGQGATFTVLLPLLREPALRPALNLAPLASGETTPVEQPLLGTQILVVEDETDTRDFIQLMLVEAGAEVTALASAQEAIACLQHWQPHLLISDIGMPQEDGFSFLRTYRRLEQQRGGFIPAIALTAYAREEDRQQAFEAGFQVHLIKPIDPWELIKVAAEWARQ